MNITKGASPAIGAKVVVYKSGTKEILGKEILGMDEVRTDFCYRSKRLPVLHFGLNDMDDVDIRILNRTGVEAFHEHLKANRIHSISVK